jgi:hypothetical protein
MGKSTAERRRPANRRERTEEDRKGDATTMMDRGPRGQLVRVENDSPEPAAVRSGKPELDLRALGTCSSVPPRNHPAFVFAPTGPVRRKRSTALAPGGVGPYML